MTPDSVRSQEGPISIGLSNKYIKKKCSVIAAIVGFAHLAKRPHYWLTGWFTVSLSVSVTKQPQCHHKVHTECRAGPALCNKFTLWEPGPVTQRPSMVPRRSLRVLSVQKNPIMRIIWGYICWRGVPQTVTHDVKVDNKCFLRGSNSLFQLEHVCHSASLGISLSSTVSKLMLHSRGLILMGSTSFWRRNSNFWF